MNDTVILLKECNSGCKTAVSGMNQVLEHVKSPALKEKIEDCRKRHNALGERCHTLLSRLGKSECDPPALGMALSRAGTELKLTADGSDRHIAEMMADGANTGMKSLARHLNDCRDATPESRVLASELIREEQDFYSDMLKFL